MHEDLTRSEDIELPTDRSFGLTAGAFFILVALAPLVHGQLHAIRWWALGVAAALVLLALFWARGLHPLNLLAFKVSRVIFQFVSPVMMSLFFFIAVTPMAMLMRAFSQDPLRLRRNAKAASYWIVREPPGPAPESMRNQF